MYRLFSMFVAIKPLTRHARRISYAKVRQTSSTTAVFLILFVSYELGAKASVFSSSSSVSSRRQLGGVRAYDSG